MSNEIFNFTVDSPFDEQINYQTLVSESEAGKEQRYQKWQRPRRTFRIRLDARALTETRNVWTFYQRHKGAFDSFLFQSPNENPVTAETLGSGDGTKTVFYAGKNVDIGTGDLIVTPGSLTVQRSIGGTGDYAATPTGDYTLDENLGQVSFSSAPTSGDVYRSTYNFRYRVRFANDDLTREAFATELWRYGLELREGI
mgnify:CR=1 FL=1